MPDAVAIVTGAASGLGAAIAEHLAAAGWAVAGVDLRPSRTALPLEADVTDAAGLVAAVAQVEEELGPVTGLVTAAGVYEVLPVGQITDAQWERVLRVNLAGTVNACAAVVPGMVARGRGAVVTISSDLGVGGSEDDAHYTASKGAIIGLTRSLAEEVADAGVWVNSVAPGAADTPLIGPDSSWRSAAFLDTLPLPRLVRPDEVAAACRLLLEQRGTFVGQVLSPNSGATI